MTTSLFEYPRMYVCMITSRIRKEIGTSASRDRLNPQRHVLVQAAVTTRCATTRANPPKRNGRATRPATLTVEPQTMAVPRGMLGQQALPLTTWPSPRATVLLQTAAASVS